MHKWEVVDRNYDSSRMTLRMRVPGGWLYRVVIHPHKSDQRDTMVFVPEPASDHSLGLA